MSARRHCPSCGAESDGPDTHVCQDARTVQQRPSRRIPSEPVLRAVMSPEMGPKKGDVLANRYEILSKAGEGGGGLVYHARDRELDLEIAVKILQPGSLSESMRKRFKREIRITRDIDHPNVSRVFDIGEASGFTFLTMRWVEGEALHRRVRRTGPLGKKELHRLAAGLVDALAAAHRIGVIHRDVKPANVLVSESGEPVLVDFGIATETNVSPSGDPRRSLERITLDGQIPGTPAFMAPEQLSGELLTPAADLWSLALTLTYAATAEPGLPSDPAYALSAFVRPLRMILVRCLEVDPTKRPRDALQIQRDLATSVRRRRFAKTAAVALVLVLLAAAGGFRSAAWAPDALPLVYVRPLENQTGDHALEWLEHGVADLVAARLEASGRVRLALDPESRQDALRVGGRIAKIDGRPTVRLALRSTDDHVLSTASVAPPTGEALFAGVDDAVARFLAKLGVSGTTAAAVEALPRHDTYDPLAWADYARARELIRQRKDVEALEALRSATTRDPTFALAQLELYVLYFYSRPGPLSEGEEALRLARLHRDRLLPDQREFFDAVLEACEPGIDARKYDHMLTYLRSHPADPWKYQTAYRIYMDSADARIPFLREWVARLPDDPEPYNQLAYTHFLYLHDARAGEEDLKTYIRLAPDLANAHDSYGEFLRHEGRLEEAQVEFDRALAIDPLFANSAYGGLDIALRRDDLADADRRLARARAAIAPSVIQYDNWVQAYLSIPVLRGDADESERRMQEVMTDPVVGSRAYIAYQYRAVRLALREDAAGALAAAAEHDRLRQLYHGTAIGPSGLDLYVAGLAAYGRSDAHGVAEAVRGLRELSLSEIERNFANMRLALFDGLLLRLEGDPSAAAERLRAIAAIPGGGLSFLAAVERARALVEAGRPADADAAYREAIESGGGAIPSAEGAHLWQQTMRESAALARRLGDEARAAALDARLARLSR